MKSMLLASIKNLAILTLITGFAYPLGIWAMGNLFMPWKAEGSMLEKQGVTVGSLLIGQDFRGLEYFHGRPSMTGAFPYNPMASGGSNYSYGNPAQRDSMEARRVALCMQNDCNSIAVPQELLEASGSGLDPEISLWAANFQVKRIAKARGVSESQLKTLINSYADSAVVDLFGTIRVNVLKLNIALDEISKRN